MVQPRGAAPNFQVIKTKDMLELVEKYHYSARLNTNEIISYGIRRDDGTLSAAALISPTRYKEPVVALGRLVRAPDCAVKMSQFISWCCNDLRTRGHKLIVSFADNTVGQHGGLYQACGWRFDGLRKPTNDGLFIDGVFVPGRTLNLRYGTRSVEKLRRLAVVLGEIAAAGISTDAEAEAYIAERGFLIPRDGVLEATHKIKPDSTIEAHFDDGKYLYWRALTVAGKTSAKRLGLKSLPYPKPNSGIEDEPWMIDNDRHGFAEAADILNDESLPHTEAYSRAADALDNSPAALADAIRAALTPDLVRPKYRGHPENPMFGHCYVASEALFHLLGGRATNYRPYHGKDDTGDTHWWLEDTVTGFRYDVTADQYFIVGKKPPYDAGRMGTFLTKEPSKRARVVMDRINLKRNQVLDRPH